MESEVFIIQSGIRRTAGPYPLPARKTDWKWVKTGLAVLLVLGTLSACVAAVYYWQYIEHFRNWGYLSALIFGFIAGSSLPVPLPYLVVTFSLGGLLNPLLVGLASGLGAGIGGSLVYLFGSGGSHLLSGIFNLHSNEQKSSTVKMLYQRMTHWTRCHGTLAVFLMSAVLNPVFVPMAVTAGALHFGFRRFLFWCVLGNVVKSTAIACCGYFGLAFILRWTGG